LPFDATAQLNVYSQANAHSHNDYEQKNPFHEAYNEQFGSIESDVHLVEGKLLVGHDSMDLDASKTLERLYLSPLSQYNDKKRRLQLLIDIKTDAVPTLERLVAVLKKYPFITKNPLIKIVISGNRPDENNYANYPSFIWFDGRLDKTYTEQQLKKIALLSDSYGKFVSWKNPWPITNADREKITAAVKKAHDLRKPIRLWASPDFPEAWEEMIKLQIDFINTDKINELSDYLTKRNSSLRLLPYNRIYPFSWRCNTFWKTRFGKPCIGCSLIG